MNSTGRIIEPAKNGIKAFQDAKYNVFHKMYEDQLSYDERMEASAKKLLIK